MNTLTRLQFVIVLFLIFNRSFSQDYTFWNRAQQWDGFTPWTQYLKYSSKFMGPNALPVPYNIAGRAGDSTFIELNSAYHYYSGDKTNDVGYNLHFNLIKNFISFEMYGVGVEHYEMDTITRDLRASRNPIPTGTAWGDVNFDFIIQLLKQAHFADVALRINLKTASGQKMEEARYTDGPAYFFDLSAGKSFQTSFTSIPIIRLKAYAGFYCWQTMKTQQRQSDAYMYSLGSDFLIKRKLWLLNEVSGYYGSLYNGDQPLIYRAKLYYTYKHKGFYLEYFTGFNDYLYQSFRFGVQFQLAKLN